jgi:hypothetical protein
MNALRRWLYRGTLSCAMCFLISLTLYNRTNHVNVKYHKLPVWNCQSEDTHSINTGILIPSTNKYINMCSIFFYCFVLSYHLIFQYLSIKLGMQILCFSFFLFRLVYSKLSESLDCHFWIALWYSLTFSYWRLTFFPNCIWTPTFSDKHNNLASVVWHTSLMLFHFNTVTTNFNGEGGNLSL